MMKLFTVYDSKAESYLPPFPMQNTALGTRAFITTLNDPMTELSKYPSDFTLFEIAKFDPSTGRIEVYEVMENLGNGLHMKAKGNNQ